MGCCCSCFKDDDNGEGPSSPASPVKPKNYGAIKDATSAKETDLLIEPEDTQREQESKPPMLISLVKDEDTKSQGKDLEQKEQEVIIPEKKEEEEDNERQDETSLISLGAESQDVHEAENEEENMTDEDEELEAKQEDSVSEGTPGKDEHTAADQGGDDASKKEKKKKEGKGLLQKTGHSMGKVTKKASQKMKKVLKKKEKAEDTKGPSEEIVEKEKRRKAERSHKGLERVSSDRMKSKYARERMEAMEKEREKQHSPSFKDPREAAHERGRKLGELSDVTDDMRNSAQGFAQTASQLAHRK